MQAGTGKVDILLVDDQPARLMTYETILEPLGQNLVCAHSGSEALEKLMVNEFALILLDVSMPGMDGFETAAMIHDHPRFERTPIIFVTGVHDTELDRLKGYELGAVDYVSVPVVPEILRSKVAVLIELHCKRRDLQILNQSLEVANRALAEANQNLQLEKARELQALNADLQFTNQELGQSNKALQAQIAERSRVEQALKEADRRKDEFLAILAHELRNPLAALSASARLLGRQAQKPEVAAMACNAVQRQVSHMARLLDDLLDVSRISHGRMQLHMDRVDVKEVVRSAVEMVRPQMESKQHVLQVELGGQDAPVLADAVRLIQVIANLLNNSVKYTPAGGQIHVELRSNRKEVLVLVRDNGIGIAPDALDQVFDMFSQAGRTSSEAQGGLGIGLTLVKGLVRLHGGNVRALSDGEGRGSEFTITLPRAHDAVQPLPTSRPDTSTEGIRPLRILVADDNLDSAMSWSALIEDGGHQVVTAYDGRAALEAAEQLHPQVALLDIGMPHLDGYEVARRIRASTWGREAMLVAVTGWGQAKDRALAREAGFDEHFTKPLDPVQLARALQNASRRLDAAEREETRITPITHNH
ncbi:MAG TPA: response regulator [Steroidobacteraceae bacterium]|nr:response regulator [Steroidobacteraceae bacterium]